MGRGTVVTAGGGGGRGVERTMRPASLYSYTKPHQYNSLTAISKQNMGS